MFKPEGASWCSKDCLAEHFCVDSGKILDVALSEIEKHPPMAKHLTCPTKTLVKIDAPLINRIAISIDAHGNDGWMEGRVQEVFDWLDGMVSISLFGEEIAKVFVPPSETETVESPETSLDVSSRKTGFVYILTNEMMPGIVKVGMTTRSPAVRAAEISSSTGVPAPFVVAKYFEFTDAMAREREFHVKHDGARLQGREFFKMSVEEAIESLMSGEKPLSAGGAI